MRPSRLFQFLQIVADPVRVAHFAPPSRLRHHRGDTVFMDIQSQIEFSFHWCVCWFELLQTATFPESSDPGRWCGSAPSKGVAREKI